MRVQEGGFVKEKLSQHEWNDPANLPSGPSDADCCDCGWHCIAGSSPESCKAQHAQHVASLAGPAQLPDCIYCANPGMYTLAHAGKHFDIHGQEHLCVAGASLAGTEPEPCSGLMLCNKADGVMGHYCVGSEIEGHMEYWNPSGWAASGFVFTDKTLAVSVLNLFRGLFQAEAEIAALRERVNGAGLSFLAIKMTSEEYARKNNLAGKPVWQNIAEEALLALKTSASSGTKEGR